MGYVDNEGIMTLTIGRPISNGEASLPVEMGKTLI